VEFPLRGSARAAVAAPAPGAGPGYWSGASCAVLDADGTYVIAYRVRNGHHGIDQTAVARSPDGETLTRVATLEETRFGARWMERPALVRLDTGGWRLFVSCGTPPPNGGGSRSLEAPSSRAWPPPRGGPRFRGTR
jgi:hypothetical protein